MEKKFVIWLLSAVCLSDVIGYPQYSNQRPGANQPGYQPYGGSGVTPTNQQGYQPYGSKPVNQPGYQPYGSGPSVPTNQPGYQPYGSSGTGSGTLNQPGSQPYGSGSVGSRSGTDGYPLSLEPYPGAFSQGNPPTSLEPYPGAFSQRNPTSLEPYPGAFSQSNNPSYQPHGQLSGASIRLPAGQTQPVYPPYGTSQGNPYSRLPGAPGNPVGY